jgi:hypothetical protein
VIQTKPSTATTEPISIIQIKQTLSEKKVKNSMKHTSTPSSSTVNKIITEDTCNSDDFSPYYQVSNVHADAR